MIGRRQLIIGGGISLIAARIAPAIGGVRAELVASHWEPTCRFALGDQLGYVVVRKTRLLYTVVVTGMSEERGGWNFELESVGQPGALFPGGEPYNSYDHETTGRLWHLFRFGPAR